MWHVEILTIFPELFENFLATSLVGKAVERGLFAPKLSQIRDFASPPHYKVDDSPYGGGAGMVMMVEPLVQAVRAAKTRLPTAHTILLSPSGQRLTQNRLREISNHDQLILVCGRYEGVDQRVIDLSIDEEISIGDFVVMGGEVPAMLLIEGALRLRPGVLHNAESTQHESFSPALGACDAVEGPQYTRPESFEGCSVPEVLRSGNHAQIAAWRAAESEKKTAKVRR